MNKVRSYLLAGLCAGALSVTLGGAPISAPGVVAPISPVPATVPVNSAPNSFVLASTLDHAPNATARSEAVEAVSIETKPVSAAPLPASAAVTPKLSLDDYLHGELGTKYHVRSEWAGATSKYNPEPNSRRVWGPLGEVKFITLHHASGVPKGSSARMIQRIFVGHTDRLGRLDASDVGYHFFVDEDGEVWQGREADKMGTHVGSRPHGLNNQGNIGICGLGSFTHDYPSVKMVSAIARLSSLISRYYGRPLTVRGHEDWQGIHGYNPLGGTDCPGHLEIAVKKAQTAINTLWPAAAAAAAAEAAAKDSKLTQTQLVANTGTDDDVEKPGDKPAPKSTLSKSTKAKTTSVKKHTERETS